MNANDEAQRAHTQFEVYFKEGGYQYSESNKQNARGWYESGWLAHAEWSRSHPSAQAPTCTCPSGDGSLRWPCPVHPPTQKMAEYLESLAHDLGERANQELLDIAVFLRTQPCAQEPVAPGQISEADLVHDKITRRYLMDLAAAIEQDKTPLDSCYTAEIPGLIRSLAYQRKRAHPSAGEVPAWSKTLPTEQAWYWHWNGDHDCTPIPLSVMYSGTERACFVSAGQLGIANAIMCRDYGGWWLRIREPAAPTPPQEGE